MDRTSKKKALFSLFPLYREEYRKESWLGTGVMPERPSRHIYCHMTTYMPPYGEWRNPGKGNTIPPPKNFHHPRNRTPVPPGLPVEGQTTAEKSQTWIWLLLPETRRIGRRSPTLASAEALTTAILSRRGRALAQRLTQRTRGLVTGGTIS